MKRVLLVLIPVVLFFFSFQPAQAQTCSDPCDSNPPLSSSPFTLISTINDCSETDVSTTLQIRNTESLVDVVVCGVGYNIDYVDNTGTTRQSFSSNQIYPLFSCWGANCGAGQTRWITNTSGSGMGYPDGEVNINSAISIQVRYAYSGGRFQVCETGSLSTSNSCIVNNPLPTPTGCTPSNVCGANGECLPTEYCDSTGQCVVPDPSDPSQPFCECDPNVGLPGDCGSGNCPLTHYCWDWGGTSWVCIEDPDNCQPCMDNSGECGANGQCNLIQKCIGGWCQNFPIDCVGGGLPQIQYPMWCDEDGNPTVDDQTGLLYTAIGCVNSENIEVFVGFMLPILLGVGGGISLLLIAIAAIMIKTSAGDPKRLQAGKELAFAAVAGLILLILSIFLIRVMGLDIFGIPGL